LAQHAAIAAGTALFLAPHRPAFASDSSSGADGVVRSPTAADAIGAAYDGYSSSYDELDGGPVASALGFTAARRELLSRAAGDVLEVGVGTGLNLRLYPAGVLASFTAVDISEGMLGRARLVASTVPALAPTAGPPPRLLRADVADLPFSDASFDTVVDTFSLCVFPDPSAALRSLARVVRPGGRVLLLEHARSRRFRPLALYQDVTAGAVARTGGKGCLWNQDVLALVERAGLRAVAVDESLAGLVVAVEAVRA
jgi:methyltransferase OMS1, mitochondrial